MGNKTVDRNISFDFIRTIAIIFVICIHSMGEMDKAITDGPCYTGIKIVNALLNSIIHTGVPLFVMLSGSLLLRKNEPIELFFKKRFKRILIPFFLWSLVVFIIKCLEGNIQSGRNIIIEFLLQFISRGTHGIYWYIYLIIGLYLLTPILRIFFSYATKRQVFYLGICTMIISLLGNMFSEIQIFSRFTSPNMIYLTYFIWGRIVSEYLYEKKYSCYITIGFFYQ